MTEDIENIIPQSKQTEFTITLPDREEQWTKCPAYVAKIKKVTQSTTETIDGIDNTVTSDPVDIEYIEMAMQDGGIVDQAGNPVITVIKLSDVTTIIDTGVNEITKLSLGNRISGTMATPTQAELKKQMLNDALVATFADDKGIVNEQALKEKATWGLGCPANCGGYREFAYSEMIPQTYVCPVCGVTINLV